MKRTYSEILNEMKKEFYVRSGERVEDFSELDNRFKAVASELYSLYCSSEFVLKQAFPQSAEGEYLDFHGELRGIKRKAASKAKLNLTFTLSPEAQGGTVIEEGCICACKDNPYIQFKTTEDAVAFDGETSVTVPAEATVSGSIGNVEADSVTVIVNPVLAAVSVTNEAPFCTGFDEESDSMLRRRIMNSYSIPSSGYSLKSIREAILEIDSITDCCVSNEGGELLIAVKTVDGNLYAPIKEKIKEKLFVADLFNVETVIVAANKLNYSLKVDVKCSLSDYGSIESERVKQIKKYTSQLLIGETLYIRDIVYRICSVDGVDYCEVSCDRADDGAVICQSDEYLLPGSIEVSCHE